MKKSVKEMNVRQLQSYCQEMITKWKENNTPTIYLPSSRY